MTVSFQASSRFSITAYISSELFFGVVLDDHKTKGSGLAPWPARLTSPPPRLADFGYSTGMFEKDTVYRNP